MLAALKHWMPEPLLGAARQARARSRHLMFWHGRGLRHELATGIEVQITSGSDWAVYNEVFVNGEYDEAIQMIVEGSDAPYVLDLGANVGYFALRFGDRWMRRRGQDPFDVICVEGSPRTYAQLQRQLSQSALRGRCRAYHALAGQRDGAAAITTSVLSGLNSIYTRQSFSRARVPFADIEQLLPPHAPVALIKCDIEGSEQSFCETYPDLLRRAQYMIIELHHELCDVVRCRQLLAAAGLVHRKLLREFSGCTVELFSRSPLDNAPGVGAE